VQCFPAILHNIRKQCIAADTVIGYIQNVLELMDSTQPRWIRYQYAKLQPLTDPLTVIVPLKLS